MWKALLAAAAWWLWLVAPVGAQGYLPLPCVGNHGTPAGAVVFRGVGGLLQTTPGTSALVGMNVSWDTSAIRVLMLFDRTTVPANGAVSPDYCFVITPVAGAAMGSAVLSWGVAPLKFNTGLVAAISTDPGGCNTLTVDGPNDVLCVQAVSP